MTGTTRKRQLYIPYVTAVTVDRLASKGKEENVGRNRGVFG